MTDTYRWTSDIPRVRQATGERFEAGDEFEPTEHELRAFGDRLTPIEESEPGGEGGEDAPTESIRAVDGEEESG